jgi:hypothetical protein
MSWSLMKSMGCLPGGMLPLTRIAPQRWTLLLVDEAYRLDPKRGGQYALDALDELCDLINKPQFHKKMVIILAGHSGDVFDDEGELWRY